MLRRCLLPLAQATAPAARTSTVRRLSSAPLPRAAASSSSSSSSGSASSSQSADVSRPFARAHRDLPPLASSSRRLGVTLLLGGATLASWLLFTAHATNRERLGSSVLKATLERVRCDEHVQQTLGAKEAAEVKLKRSSWLFGDAWVGGAVSSLQRRDDDDDARDAQGGWEGGGLQAEAEAREVQR
jgi:hypothetical protein